MLAEEEIFEKPGPWMQLINQPNISNAIRPKSWGPSCWRFLDCLAFSYPCTPSPDQQANMGAFFHALKNVLPCYSCRHDFTKMMELDPIERHLHSRESLTRWLNDKHNQVNHKLGSETMPYNVYVTEFISGQKHHSSFLSSMPTLAAQVQDGANSKLAESNSGKMATIMVAVIMAAGLFFGLLSAMSKRRSNK
jgi:hypothetical protein